jgi:hypothetical protein
MRFSRISLRVLRSLAPVIGAIGCAIALIALAPMAHAHIHADYCPASAPCTPPPPPPSPTPTPTNAFLSLDVTAGDPNTQITVNGGAFLPNESMTLIWDPPTNKVAGGAVADSSGNFTTHVKPFSGDSPGLHHLCASVQPNPCATFTLQAVAVTPTPQPSPSPSPDTSPSPSPSPTDTASPTPVAATLNGIDLMLKPPFVILPIIAGAGLAIALTYWILSIVMRPRQKPLKSVAVAHLASRPDYAAGFGTPPPVAAPPAAAPSAWADVLPKAAAAPAVSPEPPAEPETIASSEVAEVAPAEPSATAPAEPSATVPDEPPATPSESLPPDPAAAPDEPPDFPEPADY